jgi:DNA-binding transcriptional MerR regulator
LNLPELIGAVDEDGLSGVNPRLVRFLIAEGIVDPPAGSRARADYGGRQAGQIRRYLKLREGGLYLSAIRDISRALDNPNGEGAIPPVILVPGIVVSVDPGQIPSDTNPAEIGKRLARYLEQIL